MRPAIVLAASVFLMGAAGPTTCSKNLQDDEAALLDFATKIRTGAALAAQDIQSGIDLLCSNGNAVNNGVQNIKAVVAAGGPGPKTSQNLAIADKSLAVLNSVCSNSPGVGNPATLISLFKQGWSAYLTAKNSANLATAAASNGQ